MLRNTEVAGIELERHEDKSKGQRREEAQNETKKRETRESLET